MNHAPDQELIENYVFDEISIGQSARLLRVLKLEDIRAFAAVSGDTNPAHMDPEYANDTLFHGVIAHGMWSGALISALLGTQFPGPGTIYQDQALHFAKPVRVGDTLTVTVTVTSKNADNHSLELDCQVINQKGTCVLSGTARVLAPTIKVRLPRVAAPQIQLYDPQVRFKHLLAMGDKLEAVRCAVVHPCDEGSLSGAMDSARYGLIVPVLIGPEVRIRHVAEEAGIDLTGAEIINQPHSHAAAETAAELAATGNVEMLMKGSLHTDELIQAVLSKAVLRTGRRMSHVFRFDVPLYHKPLLITDAALNIRPTLQEKVDIIQNAIDFARVMGVATPKVAILSAVETVNPNIPSTIDAAALCKMADRGQITGGVLDGPLAFDNAISMHAAQIKHITSPVAGHADILAVPDLESGNMLAKQLEYLAGASGSGLVVGARVPIALTSRAEAPANRVASALLGLLAAHNARRSQPRAAW
ncbi:bifunctional enoyl-CoA hydratase/phosphate acetyltransferase [Rhodoferax antarcticus]|uniref:Bifunctional enoyl Co-A hydratase/phosphate acetyl/butyryl transferase n=1 Tax=Rhodoferax antarcticus ANT.BR TaxID=1111071 RepID=A0A1Q8YDT9_9BURK|nr:bifunctional enoyl-CoA hydratase/phosphate acetyltransferase [Rhodoferax antarcticus]APW45942.1 enoyl-CoA hydratase [Rhodoferax antarcticus]MCW2310514.1 phosphate acetyltransferase [Rhodoferax antarcticus]OLP06059.1 bifunctional enoyl Co-A hydratase/phosphate acetyl/butyryl transferase [Rhodoferax antarcticus ANT.BR]